VIVSYTITADVAPLRRLGLVVCGHVKPGRPDPFSCNQHLLRQLQAIRRPPLDGSFSAGGGFPAGATNPKVADEPAVRPGKIRR
jgi:hypothetical protein